MILYDGMLQKGDTIVLGSLGEPIQTKVRAILKPRPLTEIKSEEKFQQMDKVIAAAGIKISAPNLDGALAGTPLRVATAETIDKIVKEIKQEVDAVTLIQIQWVSPSKPIL